MPWYFNFSRSYFQHRSQVFKYRFLSYDPPGGYPMSVTGFRQGFYSLVKSNDEKTDKNDHESLIYEGVRYFIHSPYDLFSKESLMINTIATHSLVVFLDPQKTIIDKALENYEPKRLDIFHYKSIYEMNLT